MGLGDLISLHVVKSPLAPMHPKLISAPRDWPRVRLAPLASDFRLESCLSLDMPVVAIIAYRDGIEADRSYELPGFQ